MCYPKHKPEQVELAKLKPIILITTDAGPFAPDIWLPLIDDRCLCNIRQGYKGFDEVFVVFSKLDGVIILKCHIINGLYDTNSSIRVLISTVV